MAKIAIYHHLPSGGALAHLAQVAEALKQRGHHLHLFTPSTAEQNFSGLKGHVHEHTVFERKAWKPTFAPLNPFTYRHHLEACLVQERQWAEHIKNKDFDAIYTGQCRTWTEPPLLRFLPPELPITHYCQEPKRTFHEKRFLEERQRWPFWKKWWRLPTVRWMQDQMDFNIRHARQVFCNSDFSKQRIEQAYPKLICQTQVIGVDTQTFSPDLSSEIKPQIITVGALDPSKNHGFAIDVAAQKPGGKKLNVIVITDRSYGDTAEQLKHKAKELDVTLDIRVRVSTQELVQLYRESLATVYTPIEEPFGIVSIESQACGTPVLGVDEGGIKETLLHGVGGFRLSRNAEHFAEHLKDWIEQPISREKISLQAREHILKHWSKDACLASIIDRIESILKNP